MISQKISATSWFYYACALFSADPVYPDIVYCVEMYNITCGRRDLIISDYTVTESSYTYNDIAPHGYIYEYIGTPRNNVP